MEYLRSSFMLVLLALIVLPVWADNDVHINKECNNRFPMLEVNNCASFKFAEADEELNKLYKLKLAESHSLIAKNRLKEAQRAWIKFRDGACLYEAGSSEESGSSWAFEHFGCLEFYTRRRIEDIEMYLRCTSDDCP